MTSIAAVAATPATAPAAQQWTGWSWVTPQPQGYELFGVASSDQSVVAVGDQGSIVVSDNGIDWKTERTTANLTLFDVAWTGDLFVAVGGFSGPAVDLGVVLTSSDGHAWSESATVPGAMLNAVLWNGVQILATGQPGVSLTSPDGHNWAVHEISDHPDSNILDVAWNGSTYLGVGTSDASTGASPIYLSSDGVNWITTSLDGIPPTPFRGVVWGHGQFLVFGDSWPRMISSTDGNTWEEVATDPVVYLDDAVAVDDGYVAVIESGKVGTSIDGVSWSTQQVFPSYRRLHAVSAFQDGYIVVGDYGAIAEATDPAEAWTVNTTWVLDLDDPDDVITGLCSVLDTKVAVTSSGQIFWRTDLEEWQEVADYPSPFNAVRWLQGAFWAVGSRGLIATSDDGEVWNRIDFGALVDLRDITTNDDILVAVGNRDDPTVFSVVATSTDGQTWDQVFIEDSQGLRILSVTWTGSEFVAVGDRGSLFHSDDGLDWHLGYAEASSSLRGIVSDGSAIIAAGKSRLTDDRGVLIASRNSITWHASHVPQELLDVIWTGERFIALGIDGALYSSFEGRAWASEPTGFSWHPECLIADEESILVGGPEGGLLQAWPLSHSWNRPQED